MTVVTLNGNPITTSGELPAVDDRITDFTLVAGDLQEKTLADFSGKRKVLNIVPSLDTGVCAASARYFNQAASEMENTIVLIISADLPFAQKRFCEAEGLENVVPLSSFRSAFADDYNLRIIDGPLKGLNSRCVIITNENNQVIYTEQVPEIAQEPDYEAALAALE